MHASLEVGCSNSLSDLVLPDSRAYQVYENIFFSCPGNCKSGIRKTPNSKGSASVLGFPGAFLHPGKWNFMSVLSFPSPFLNMTNSFWQCWVTSHLPGPNPSPLTTFPVVPLPVQPASVSPSWYHHTKRCWRISLSWYFQKSSLSGGMIVIQCGWSIFSLSQTPSLPLGRLTTFNHLLFHLIVFSMDIILPCLQSTYGMIALGSFFLLGNCIIRGTCALLASRILKNCWQHSWWHLTSWVGTCYLFLTPRYCSVISFLSPLFWKH